MSTNRKKKDKDNDKDKEEKDDKEEKEEKPSPKKEKRERKKKDKETPSKDASKDKDGKDGDDIKVPGSPPKPQSAGANTRDAAQRILALTQKGEWSPIDNILKQMERAIANAQVNGEEVNTQPLNGVADPVSTTSFLLLTNFFLMAQVKYCKIISVHVFLLEVQLQSLSVWLV